MDKNETRKKWQQKEVRKVQLLRRREKIFTFYWIFQRERFLQNSSYLFDHVLRERKRNQTVSIYIKMLQCDAFIK